MISSESYIFLAVLAALALVALVYLLSPMSLIDELIARRLNDCFLCFPYVIGSLV